MQPTLEPIAKIPLERTPAGETYNPELAFSPDGAVLYVRQPVVLVGGWDWVRWHAPEVAGVVLLVVVVWLLRLTRRVMGRKQELGCVYCRLCNYELTPPIADEVRAGRAEWLSAEAKCPECGKRTKKAPAVGSLRRWRLLPWVGLGAAVLIACAMVMVWSLTPLRPREGPTWPVAGIERVAPGLAFQRERSHFPLVHRLTKWELPTGKRVGMLAVEPVYGMNNGALSPDGKVWALGCWDVSVGAETELVLVDAGSGARRGIGWGQQPMGMPTVIGFAADSKSVLVQTTLQAADGGTTVTLDEVDVGTLTRREAARVNVARKLTPAATEATYPYYLIDPADPERKVLVVVQQERNAASLAMELTVLEGEKQKKIAATLPAGGWYSPRWVGAGVVEIPMVGLTPNARVDVGSGVVSAVSQPAHPVVGRTSDGALEAQFVAKTTQVWDVAKGTAVATLGAGGGATSAVVFSADGKLAASAVTALKAGAAAGSRQAGDWETTVWVWRLPE